MVGNKFECLALLYLIVTVFISSLPWPEDVGMGIHGLWSYCLLNGLLEERLGRATLGCVSGEEERFGSKMWVFRSICWNIFTSSCN